MPSLPQVLHEASIRGATEITLESDQHPMMTTDAGSVTVGDPLSESELFDALALVLGPDQQAELALGNIVSFGLDVGGEQWGLVAEPALEGIIVRGRSGAAGAESTAEGEAFSSARALDLPKLDTVEPDRQTVPSTGKSILRPTKRRTQWDIGVPEAPVPMPAVPSPPPSKPSWSRQLDDDAASDFEIRTPTGEQPANLVDAHDALVGDNGDNGDNGDDGDADPEILPLPELIPPPEPQRGPEREREREREREPEPEPVRSEFRDRLLDFASSIDAGTLCIVQGEGGAEALAMSIDGGEFALIDDATPGGVLRAAAELEPGARFAVLLEDPSAILGWILRRLEEGARIVVQSRARTGPGARRCLLGTQASDRAEHWLSLHPMIWFAEEADGWSRHEL